MPLRIQLKKIDNTKHCFCCGTGNPREDFFNVRIIPIGESGTEYSEDAFRENFCYKCWKYANDMADIINQFMRRNGFMVARMIVIHPHNYIITETKYHRGFLRKAILEINKIKKDMDLHAKIAMEELFQDETDANAN